MRRLAVIVLVLASAATLHAQKRPVKRAPAKKPAPVALKRELAKINCPSPLGQGMKTAQLYCDVLAGREPEQGILIPIPPHSGTATVTFELHNRHTYSEDQVLNKRAYTRYTATVGLLTMNNDLIDRAVIQSEFRTAADLVDRIAGGAGPQGVKAVAPTGREQIAITVPAKVDQVSLLGEKLETVRLDGRELYSTPGRPIAVVSNIMIEYRPAPARRRR